ncbi:MAG: hypothetical protein IT379_23200 [Deltaproteobacteria bacterium]|nr:hypothetical protein [Deltaproteobacteria bacterium]
MSCSFLPRRSHFFARALVFAAALLAGCLSSADDDAFDVGSDTRRVETTIPLPAQGVADAVGDSRASRADTVAPRGGAGTGPNGCYWEEDLAAECPGGVAQGWGERAFDLSGRDASNGPVADTWLGVDAGDGRSSCFYGACFVERARLQLASGARGVALPPEDLAFIPEGAAVESALGEIVVRDPEGRLLAALTTTGLGPLLPSYAGLSFALPQETRCASVEIASYGCQFFWSTRSLRVAHAGGTTDIEVGDHADVETAEGRFRVTHFGNAQRVSECATCAVAIPETASFAVVRLAE